MKVLVTGGAGFIGSNLCRQLVSSFGLDVRVLDDFSTAPRANLDSVDVEIIEGSVLDADMVGRAANDVDAIVHLAAIPSVPRSITNPRASHDANATGTLSVLEVARRKGTHVVVASSSSVYGANTKLPKTADMVCRPLSPYAVSKLATESYALAYQASYGLDTLAFRFFNVYGPRQLAGHAYAAVIPKFVDAALRSEPLTIHGDGTQSRDFTYVETVTSVIARAIADRVASSTPVNLALGTRTSLNELVTLLSDAMGTRLDVTFGPKRAGDVSASQADPSDLLRLFPGISGTSLADGLSQTIDWLSRAM